VRLCLENLVSLCTQLEDYVKITDYVGQLREIAQARKDVAAEAQALIMLGIILNLKT
jgi:hypothetical protein